MEKRKVENYRNLWILSQTSRNYLLSVADENSCESCKKFKWIVHIKLNNNLISQCLECLEKSNIICKPQNCPFSNPSAKEAIVICKPCCELLIEHTKELYESE